MGVGSCVLICSTGMVILCGSEAIGLNKVLWMIRLMPHYNLVDSYVVRYSRLILGMEFWEGSHILVPIVLYTTKAFPISEKSVELRHTN